MSADSEPARSRYVPHRVNYILDSPLNPDYLVLHPKIGPLQNILKKKRPHVILDVGCGSKKFANFIGALLPSAAYLGLDIQNNKEGNIDGLIEGAHCLPVKENSVDLIICNQVLEHVDRPVEAVNEFSRVLKQGGALFLAAPFMEPEHEIPFDFFRYTRFGLYQLLENAGFHSKSIHVTPIGGAIAAFAQSLITFLAQRERANEPGIVMGIKKLFFWRPCIYCFNRFISWADATYFRPNPVIGYLVIAEK